MSESGGSSESSFEKPITDGDDPHQGFLASLLMLEKRGLLKLVRDVIQIETGRRRGQWAIVDGRLWVIRVA